MTAKITEMTFARHHYIIASLICCIFYSVFLGMLNVSLNCDLATPDVATLDDTTLERGLKIMTLLFWLVCSIGLAYGSEKILERVGFGTIALSTTVSIVESFASFNLNVIILVQILLSLVIVIVLARSVYKEIRQAHPSTT